MSNTSDLSQAAVAAPELGLYGREFTRSLQRLTVSAFATLREWEERMRQRRRLSELDDRMLTDIGLTRADVSHEVKKPFWVR